MQLVLGFERAEAPTRPFSTDSIQAYITHLTTTCELPTQGRWLELTGTPTIRGRGTGAPSAEKFVNTLKAIETDFGLRSNADDPAVKHRLQQMRKMHVRHSAPVYDMVEARACVLCCALSNPTAHAALLGARRGRAPAPSGPPAWRT